MKIEWTGEYVDVACVGDAANLERCDAPAPRNAEVAGDAALLALASVRRTVVEAATSIVSRYIMDTLEQMIDGFNPS